MNHCGPVSVMTGGTGVSGLSSEGELMINVNRARLARTSDCDSIDKKGNSRSPRRRVAGIALAAALLGTGGAVLVAPSALADSVTSPTGMVTVSAPPSVVAGSAATYTVTVTDTTAELTDGVLGVVVDAVMPTGMTIQRVSGCANLGGNHSTSLECTMPNLSSGGSETATISILAAAAGTYQLSFGAATGVPDPADPGAIEAIGDSTTLSVTAQAAPTDVQVTGSSNNGSPLVGSTYNYTFQVKDNGPQTAAGVSFDDQLPSGVTLVGVPTIDNGACTADAVNETVHCDIAALVVGQQSTITLTAAAATTGLLTDTAAVRVPGGDIQPNNNAVTVTVQPRSR